MYRGHSCPPFQNKVLQDKGKTHQLDFKSSLGRLRLSRCCWAPGPICPTNLDRDYGSCNTTISRAGGAVRKMWPSRCCRTRTHSFGIDSTTSGEMQAAHLKLEDHRLPTPIVHIAHLTLVATFLRWRTSGISLPLLQKPSKLETCLWKIAN